MKWIGVVALVVAGLSAGYFWLITIAVGSRPFTDPIAIMFVASAVVAFASALGIALYL